LTKRVGVHKKYSAVDAMIGNRQTARISHSVRLLLGACVFADESIVDIEKDDQGGKYQPLYGI